MTSIPSLFGAPNSAASPASFAQETQIILDAFELGAFLSLKVGDMNAFERHISQVKTISFAYKLVLPDPKNQALLTGLHLMHLLSQTRIAEFHTALETVAPALHSHACIQANPSQPLSLSPHPQPPHSSPYASSSTLWRARTTRSCSRARRCPPPNSKSFSICLCLPFVTPSLCVALHLIFRVRALMRAQDCSEDAYDELSVAHATRLLMFSNQQELITWGLICVSRDLRLSYDDVAAGIASSGTGRSAARK